MNNHINRYIVATYLCMICLQVAATPYYHIIDTTDSRKGSLLFSKVKIITFTYQSQNVYGQPDTLSAIITMREGYLNDKTEPRHLILYNHYTITGLREAPSGGSYYIPAMLAKNTKEIVVSADYPGFGVDSLDEQGYYYSQYNAQASIDALRAARQLLEDNGHKLYQSFFNTGFSQGGQTTIEILRLQADNPDLEIAKSYAGGGPYDIEATYRWYLSQDKVTMPCVVPIVLMSYNLHDSLNIAPQDILDQWVINMYDTLISSKQYDMRTINRIMGKPAIADIITDSVKDGNSTIMLAYRDIWQRTSLVHDWQPDTTINLWLFHSINDDVVPFVNAELLDSHLAQFNLPNYKTQFGKYGNHYQAFFRFLVEISKDIKRTKHFYTY